MLTLEETKLYLRVDHNEEDSLIASFISTAQEMVEGVLRRKLAEYDLIPETIKQAMLFVIGTLYESRQVTQNGGINMTQLLNVVKNMLFAYRDETRW
ncbi:MAG: phage gp6-like head-tail connector protein [Clostridia bacterium]|nr:phage gp6-like head-tail connector protein [Clostridia bacterium]